MSANGLIAIGRITKAHGIRGEVCVEYYADSPQLLQGEIFLQAQDAPPRPVIALAVRNDNARLLVRFEGVNDRNAAELLRNTQILICEDALPPLDEGEAYIHELLGCQVAVLGPDGSLRPLGTLDQISFPASQELWSILTPEGREVLLPAVPEFVAAIDARAKSIHITPPPGLLELYSE